MREALPRRKGIRVGIVSDTHGLLRDSVVAALRGSNLILHAGDIGKSTVLEGLRALAPVVAIRGNVDSKWAHDLPDTEDLTLAGRRLHVLHDLKELSVDPVATRIDVVVSGHSHVPGIERRAGVLYVNPGSAGPRRFRLPIALATLDLGPSRIRARIVELED
jgi:putative phosphoesterase